MSGIFSERVNICRCAGCGEMVASSPRLCAVNPSTLSVVDMPWNGSWLWLCSFCRGQSERFYTSRLAFNQGELLREVELRDLLRRERYPVYRVERGEHE